MAGRGQSWKNNPYFQKGTEEKKRADVLKHNQKHHDKASARMKELNSKLTREECQRRRAKSFKTHPELKQRLSELRKMEWETGKRTEYGKKHAAKYFQPYNEKRAEEAKRRKQIQKNIEAYTNNPNIKYLPKQDESYYDELDDFFGGVV